MLALKAVLYALTAGSAFSFGIWELRLRNQLTDDQLEQKNETPGDSGFFFDLKRQFRRERILAGVTPGARSKYRVVAGLKFLFAAILVIEVIVLQR